MAAPFDNFNGWVARLADGRGKGLMCNKLRDECYLFSSGRSVADIRRKVGLTLLSGPRGQCKKTYGRKNYRLISVSYIEEDHTYKLALWEEQRTQTPKQGAMSQDLMSYWGMPSRDCRDEG